MASGNGQVGLGQIVFETIVGLVATGVVWLVITVRDMGARVRELLEMHRHPDDTGFGTRRMDEKLDAIRDEMREMNRSMREMIHYQRYTAQAINGNRPPPPPPSAPDGRAG